MMQKTDGEAAAQGFSLRGALPSHRADRESASEHSMQLEKTYRKTVLAVSLLALITRTRHS